MWQQAINGGRSRTSNIACYMSKLYRGAIAPTIAEASCLYPDTSCYLLPYKMSQILAMSEFQMLSCYRTPTHWPLPYMVRTPWVGIHPYTWQWITPIYMLGSQSKGCKGHI